MPQLICRPKPEDVPVYFQRYTDQVPTDDFLGLLKQSIPELVQFLTQLSEPQWMHRYAPGKWSIKELMLHLIDTERVMAYRALAISRDDKTPLPGFDQDIYAPSSRADQRSGASIIAEFEAVRQATIQLFQNFDNDHMECLGTASGKPFTPRGLGFVIAGHQIHHMKVVKERYL